MPGARSASGTPGIAAILASAAFHPVFQPIVDLEGGEVVGYEALTRFDSGQRPDLCFADAWAVGLGAEMELATLGRGGRGGSRLPPGALARPQRLAAPARRSRGLREILWSAGDRSCSR